MRKHIRKPMLFLAALLAIALAYFLPGKGTLAHAEETDAGGTRAEAKVIELGKTYSETTDSGSDVDFFKFTTTGQGYFRVNLKQNESDKNDTDGGWYVKVLDESGEVITSQSYIRKNWTSVNIPYAKAGRAFYLEIGAEYTNLAPLNCVYDLTVNQTEAGDWELETNETKADATAIGVNKMYHGITISGDDKDFYKFTATKQGYFQVTLKHNEADENDTDGGWYVKVLDESGEVITSQSYIRKNWTSMNIPYAKAGRAFYLEIGAEYTNLAPLNCVYDLTVDQTEAGDWELETNETKADATAIGVNKTYHGITISGDDKDFYKFTATKQGYFQVTLKHNEADKNDTDAGWHVKVLDESGEEITSCFGIKTNWTSIILPYAKEDRVFYVQVMPAYNNMEPRGCVYDLTVMQTAEPSWESEPNGTKKTAVSMKMGKKQNGITGTEADEDYYKLNVAATGKLRVKLSSHNANPAAGIGSGWTVFVYDKKFKGAAKMEQVKTADSVTLDVKKGTYYIVVKPYRPSTSIVGCRYTLLADYTKAPAAPKISSVKAGKKSAVVKWKKASGATGYYVYRSTSPKGGFKKVQTLKRASALSWKNKKLKSGRKYYYKVAAYKKVKGMTVVSSYSAVKSVKVK